MAVFSGARAFYAITFGQFVSLVGSSMTRFGLGIWVLRETGDTTAYSAPLVLIALVAVSTFARSINLMEDLLSDEAPPAEG